MAKKKSPTWTADPRKPNAFASVPYEITLLLLKSLDSFNSLFCLIRTSSLFYDVFTQNADLISRAIAFRTFPPEAFRALDICRPSYTPDTDGHENKEETAPPVPLVSPFARRFLHHKGSTMTVKSEIGRVDHSLSPECGVIGYYEARRLCKNHKTVDAIAIELVDACLQSDDGRMSMYTKESEETPYPDFHRAIYNIYVVASQVFTTLPYAVHHHKYLEIDGVDCLSVLDIPHGIVHLMYMVLDVYAHSEASELQWDLAWKIIAKTGYMFSALRSMAFATQLLAFDVLALEGESKPYGQETDREHLWERVEILRTLLPEQGEHSFEGGFFDRPGPLWTKIDIDEHYKRKILVVSSYVVDNCKQLPRRTATDMDRLRHKYLDATTAITNTAPEGTSKAERIKRWQEKQAAAWESSREVEEISNDYVYLVRMIEFSMRVST